jgi:hypothetical protein
VNPAATRLERLDAPRTELSVPSRGALAGAGEVLEREGRIAVIDAGWPLVVALPDEDGAPEVGAFVAFEADAPIHGFVLPPERRRAPVSGREVDEAH